MPDTDPAAEGETERDTNVEPKLTAYTEITVTHREETEDQP
jgi:hypothetical protein